MRKIYIFSALCAVIVMPNMLMALSSDKSYRTLHVDSLSGKAWSYEESDGNHEAPLLTKGTSLLKTKKRGKKNARTTLWVITGKDSFLRLVMRSGSKDMFELRLKPHSVIHLNSLHIEDFDMTVVMGDVTAIGYETNFTRMLKDPSISIRSSLIKATYRAANSMLRFQPSDQAVYVYHGEPTLDHEILLSSTGIKSSDIDTPAMYRFVEHVSPYETPDLTEKIERSDILLHLRLPKLGWDVPKAFEQYFMP